MKKEKIIVAGIELTEESFPNLYRFAEVNPDGLENTLRSLAKASGGKQDDLMSCAINFENDLSHE